MSADVHAISVAVRKCICAREDHKTQLLELRRIAVEECGFDQETVMKSNPIDLLDGFVKGYLARSIKEGGAK